jgi:acetyltransferase-like isoleucine patch superfamily enzyme
MAAEIHPTATVYPGTVLGEGVKVLENAVVGKQPSLSPRSTAKREPVPPTEIGDGTIVSTGAIVFAGSKIGARVVLGDQSCVRERVSVGDDVVLGRGSLVENDTTIGPMTKIQANAYITAYSTLEEHVFIAPCVVTTNDNFMGRTEKRHELVKGPTIRRGARVGGGAILCPGVEIGEEAFVGAGAVVTRDVPPPRHRRRQPGARPARRCRGRAARALALDDGESVARRARARDAHLHVVRPGRPRDGTRGTGATRVERRCAPGTGSPRPARGSARRQPEREAQVDGRVGARQTDVHGLIRLRWIA